MSPGMWLRRFFVNAVARCPVSKTPGWARAILLVVLAALTGCGASSTADGPRISSPPAAKHTQRLEDPGLSQTDAVAQTMDALVRLGWSENAARAVAELNRALLQLAWETDRSQWKKTVELWARLGKHANLQRKLERMPEFASLLAGALEERADAGELIVQSIPDDLQARDMVSSL